jgi:hypothetical protein
MQGVETGRECSGDLAVLINTLPSAGGAEKPKHFLRNEAKFILDL